MNRLYPCLGWKLFSYSKIFSLLLASFLIQLTSFSQIVPELVFKNAELKTGPGAQSAGSDGAVYVFKNVTDNVDALVVINGRSSSDVTLSNIDLVGPIENPSGGTGYDNAWQPRVAYDGGSAPANQSWWMEFQITFVKHDDNTTPVSVSEFNVTGLDIDGDGANLHECLSFYALQTYTLEQNTMMGSSNSSGCLYNLTSAGKEFDGPTKNYPNITPTATDVMVTNHYSSTNSFVVRVGAKTGSTASNAADRMNSLWFKSFQFQTPVVGSLPFSLSDFTAQLGNNKNVVLNWETTMEAGTSHFTVQRSSDGQYYDDAGIVFADGESKARKDYSFSDPIESSSRHIIYYRLKMVDLDSKYRYSEVVVVRIGETAEINVSVYPNPAISELRVTIPSDWQNKPISYNIYNTNGVLIKQKISSNAGQTETLHVADLPVGMYIVKTENGHQTAVQKFMKAN
jgi:hypothetical protein